MLGFKKKANCSSRSQCRRRQKTHAADRYHVNLRDLRLELLEPRTLLSGSGIDNSNLITFDHVVFDPATGLAVPASTTPLSVALAESPTAGSTPWISSGPVGLTPVQIRTAYGINSATYGSLAGSGAGQTIAIIDAFDDPNLVASTASNFLTSDLHKFDLQFGLPDPPSFLKLNENGAASPLPAASGATGWSVEESLDVEWAHAIAPQANIILFEANGTTDADLMTTAVNTARNYAGVSVITMSFGRSEEGVDPSMASLFTTPTGHSGVTFLASTGDDGSPGEFPAYCPNIVAVGGTTLTLSGNNYLGEVGWSGSGGGPSSYESEASCQEGVQTSGWRQIPDVSFDADPNSGVAVYDSYDYGSSTPWEQIGGTSVASPCWAGLVAIGDQFRTSVGLTTMDGPTQTLPLLYGMKAADFHDITSGSNGGFTAHAGYDEVTGIGTPVANNLLPAFVPASSKGTVAFSAAAYEIGTSATITVGDLDLNGDLSCSVTLTSSAGDSETLNLPAQGDGIFTGSILTSASPVVAGDGILETVPGGTITVAYDDANDGTGHTAVDTATATTYSVGYYTFSAIASPEAAGVPFSVKATAYDTFGNLIPSYGGTVSLTASGQAGALSINPTSVTFSSGVWTGNVTVNALDPSVTLQLANATGAVGTSTVFATQVGPVASFQFSTIVSPQSENYAFPVTITATDANGDPVTSFNGSVALSGATGAGSAIAQFLVYEDSNDEYFQSAPSAMALTYRSYNFLDDASSSTQIVQFAKNEIQALLNMAGSPVAISPATAALVNGTWTGNVTVTQTSSSMHLIANDGSGQVGSSNTFSVAALAPLTEAFPANATEGVGTVNGTVSIPAALASPLTVSLTSSDNTRATVPSSVMILAGQTSAAVPIAIINTGLLDGPEAVTIAAAAAGYNRTSGTIEIHGGVTAVLGVSLPATAPENGGTLSGTVTSSAAPSQNVTVTLTSNGTTHLTVPATVTLPAGQTSASFTATLLDDHVIETQPMPVTVTAQMDNWTSGAATIDVLDEDATMAISLPASGWKGQTLSGTVTIGGTLTAPLAVSLVSSNTTQLTLPATVTIPAGSLSATFTATLVDNGLHTGPQTAEITATASGLPTANANVVIDDADVDHFTFSGLPAVIPAGTSFPVTARAYDVLNNLITVCNATEPLSAAGVGGTLVVSPTTITFVSGVWTGNVTINTADTAATLNLNNGIGAMGVGSPIDVYAPLAVLTTSPPVCGVLTLPVSAAAVTLNVNFNQPIAPASVATSSLVLSGISGATVTAVSVLPGNTTAAFTLSGITSDGTLSASIAVGAVLDQYGYPNLAFSGSYATCIVTQPFPVPLTAVNPLGSLVYGGSQTAAITQAGETESFTIALDPGQTLTAFVAPAASLQPTVTIVDPSGTILGTATASALGQQAVVQTVPVTTEGTYTVTLGGAAGAGSYTLQLDLNAAVESGLHGGPSNNTFAAAQSLNPAFASLGTVGQRAAVLGATAGNSEYYSMTVAAGQSLTAGLASLVTDNATLNLYNSAQTLVATGTTITTNLNAVISNYVAPTSGAYYLQVNGNGEPYDMVVTLGAAFDTHPNGTFATAQNISNTTGVLGALGGMVGSGIHMGLIQDALPWGSNSNTTVATGLGYTVTLIPSASLATANLSAYSMIVLAGDQSSATYAAVQADLPLIQSYVSNGGVWVVNDASASSSTPYSYSLLPNATGVSFVALAGTVVNVLAPTSGLINGPGGTITNTTLDGGTYSDHAYTASAMPAGGTAILDNGAASEVVAFNYPDGLGQVIAHTIPVEYYGGAGNFGIFQKNLFNFAASFAATTGNDYYIDKLIAGQTVHFATSTPADGPGEFENSLSPHIQLYDPSGNLVASGTVGADGRNETIDYTALVTGGYRIQVSAKNGTRGEYVLSLGTPLTLAVPANETEGVGTVNGTVSMPIAPAGNLTVSLVSSDPNRLMVPATVTILAGQTSATVPITIVNTGLLDGPEAVTITAAAPACDGALGIVEIHGGVTAVLGVSLPATAPENGGTVSGTVTSSAAPSQNMTVTLTSNGTTHLTVPATVTLPAGQTSVNFTATLLDDHVIESQPMPVTVTAQMDNWTIGAATIDVLDEDATMAISLPASGWKGQTLSGTVTIGGTLTAPLAVSLVSSNTTQLTLPATVTIPAGSLSATFAAILVDNGLHTGPQTAEITATASGLPTANANVIIDDADVDHFTFSGLPAVIPAGTSFPVTARAYDVLNNLITVCNATVPLSATGLGGTLAVSPASITFVSGAWTGNVTINTADTAATLNLNNGIGAMGVGSPIDVYTPLAVLTTSPPVGGVLTLPVSAAPVTLTVNFNQPIAPASVATSSLVLSGISGATVTAVSVLPGNTTAAFTLSGITSDGTLSASIAVGAILDQYGYPNLAFSGSYITDIVTQGFPTPLTSVAPAGSLIYDGSIPDVLSPAGITHSYTLAIDPYQTVSVLVAPTSSGLQPSVQLLSPTGTILGTATAAAAGQDALIQATATTGMTTGTYQIVVGGVGSTVGNYSLQVTLNAALDAAAYLTGVSNGALATALPLDGSFQTLSTSSSGTRGAVLGSNAASAMAWNNYYSVNLNAGDVITTGLENLSGSGTAISLLSPAGVTLASGAPGLTNLSQAIGGFSIPAGGTYYLRVTGEAAASYDVVVTRNAAFSLLPHGTSATAQNISSTGVVLGYIGAAGANTSIVVPNANATVEGNSANGYPFNTAAFGVSSLRYQQIYSSTQFASGGLINALKFRLDGSSSPFSTSGINVQIDLGYAATTEATASSTFASNRGAGMVTVYNGLLSLSSTSNTSPRAFDIVINVAPLFNYNPLQGDLLVDVFMRNEPSTTQFDAVTGGTATTRVYSSTTGSVNDLTGAVQSGYGLVTDFSFTAQETSDWYSINVPTAGIPLSLATSTPADGSGEFENSLSPHIQLYDPSGNLVASGIVRSDGRTETINYTPLLAGAYRVCVTAKSNTQGEYVLTVQQGVPDTNGPSTTDLVATPALTDHPPTITATVSDSVAGNNAVAAEYFIDTAGAVGNGAALGGSSSSPTLNVSDTLTAAVFNGLAQGTHTIYVHGRNAAGYWGPMVSVNFVKDTIPPVVTVNPLSTLSPTPTLSGGVSDPTATVQVTIAGQTYPATNNGDGTWTLPGSEFAAPLVAGVYTVQATATDPAGNVGYDGTTRELTVNPLAIAQAPAGSLVYSAPIDGNLSSPGLTDVYTVTLDAGETVSLGVAPSSSLQPTAAICDPSGLTLGSATAAMLGSSVLVETVTAVTNGNYTLRIGSVGSTIGTYTASFVLNAAVEGESYGSPTNNTLATAQDLTPSFVSLGTGTADRGAVLGNLVNSQQLLVNGGFETGDFTGWTATSTAGSQLTPWTVSPAGGGYFFNSQPLSGNYSALNGFDGIAGLQYQLYQNVTIPAGATSAVLTTHDRIVYSNNGTGTQSRTFQITLRDTANNILQTLYTQPVPTAAALMTDLGWQTQTFNLAAYAGQTVRVYFSETVPQSYTGPAMLELDNLSLQAAVPAPDWYSFPLTAGESATIGLESGAGAGISLQVYNAAQNLLAQGVSAANLTQVINNFVAPASGTYYVCVSGSGSAYDLVVTRNADFDTGPNGTVTWPGGTGAQTLSAGSVLGAVTSGPNYYKLILPSAGQLSLSTSTPGSGAGQFVNTLDPCLALYDASGNLLASAQNNLGGTNAAINQPLATGTYFVEIAAPPLNPASQGEYILSQAVTPGAIPPPVVSIRNAGPMTFIRGGAAVAVAPNLTVADSCSACLLWATVNLSGGPLDPGAETLAANTAGTSIAGSYNAASGMLTLSGSDTLAHYQQVLRSVTYVDTRKSTTSTSNRMLDFAVSDASNASTPVGDAVAFDVAPQIVGVYVSGTAWAQGSFSALAAAGVGDPTLGYELASGPGQLSNANLVGWVNVNTISIVFSKPVSGVALSSLSLGDSGNNGGTPSGITPNGQASPSATVATFTLSAPLTSNKYYLDLTAAGITDAAGAALDGEWTTGVSTFAAGSGDGAPGGDFVFRFNVLSGDLNRDGRVSAADVNIIRNQPPATDNATNWIYDVHGDGQISAADEDIERSLAPVAIAAFPEPILPASSPSTASWSSTAAGTVVHSGTLIVTNSSAIAANTSLTICAGAALILDSSAVLPGAATPSAAAADLVLGSTSNLAVEAKPGDPLTGPADPWATSVAAQNAAADAWFAALGDSSPKAILGSSVQTNMQADI